MDAENLIASWLRTQTGKRVGNEAPSDLSTDFIRVVRIGGSVQYWEFVETATIAVDYFGADRGASIAGAESVRDLMIRSLPGQVLDGHAVWSTRTVSVPHVAHWDDTEVRRTYASYNITLRRRGVLI